MKKKVIFSLLYIGIVLLTVSCKIVEMQSEPILIKLVTGAESPTGLKVMTLSESGEYSEVLPIFDQTTNYYPCQIQSMGGGYSAFLGMKYKKHLPNDYDVIKIVYSDNTFKEYSINDCKQFQKDQYGNYIIP